MSLTKIFAPLALSVAVVAAAAPAFAQTPPRMTDAEKAIVKKGQAFTVCSNKATPQVIEKVTAQIKAILAARNEATRKALISAGMPEASAEQLTGMMGQGDAEGLLQTIGPILMAKEAEPYLVKCGKDLGIGTEKGFTEEFKAARDAVVKKFGPKVFEVPATRPEPEARPV